MTKSLWAEVGGVRQCVQGEVTDRLSRLELINVVTAYVHTLFPSTHASHTRDAHLWQFEGATLERDILK